MKHLLRSFSLVCFLCLVGSFAFGQSALIKRTIVVTDTITDDEGVTLAASSDDAEQENDEIDTLYDDDIDSGWEGDPEDLNILTAGMRFRNISIPKGATIDSAYIVVFSHEGKAVEDVARITITADASDDSPTFTEDSLITARDRTSASILWEVAEEWEIYQPYRTVDLSAIVQEVVDREGWQSGNALSFIFQGEDQGPSEVDNAREWEAFENIADPEDGGDGQNHPERVPQLYIYFSGSEAAGFLDIPIVVTDTITDDEGVTLAASSDDAEQENDEIDTLFDDDIDAGWEGEPEDLNILTAGLRFQNIQLPQGAQVDSAFIVVFSHEGKTAEDVARITIVGDASDNAPTFTEDSLLTERAETAASVLWEVAEEWEIYQEYRTADIASIVQEIANREGWEPGNAMAFILKGEDQGPSELENAREWEAFENIADPEDGGDGQNHPERVARLQIFFSGSEEPVEPVQGSVDIPIVVTDTITDDEGVTLAASSDDAEQENDEIDTLFDDDIDAGWEGEPDDQNILTAGMRFQDVQIPQGATIDSSYIVVYSHEGKTTDDVARITITADASDDAPTFTEDSLITDRARTEASLLWVVAEEWEIYQPYRTLDLSPIVQEIVNREGWDAGNAMAFIFQGEDQGPSEVENAREWEAFENIADPEDGGDGQNHPERVPRLVVYYTEGIGKTTPIRTTIPVSYNQLRVYPNPIDQGRVTVELVSEKAASMKLFNQKGQLVLTKDSIFGKQLSIDANQLAAGMYFIQVQQNEQLYTQKLLVAPN